MKIVYPKRKDYDRLYTKAKRILERELLKPSAEWDEALISECEETMLFCSERGEELRSASVRTGGAHPALKRALVITLAVLASLLILATVAQAAGLHIWSAIIHWDHRYLYIEYNDNSYPDPPSGAVGTGEHATPVEIDEEVRKLQFTSAEELRAYLGSEILCPDEALDEFLTISRVDDSFDIINVYSDYSVSGRELYYSAIHSRSGFIEGSYSVMMGDLGEYDSVTEKEIDGVACVFGEGNGKGICTFRYENTFYCLGGEFTAGELEEIAAGMLAGR